MSLSHIILSRLERCGPLKFSRFARCRHSGSICAPLSVSSLCHFCLRNLHLLKKRKLKRRENKEHTARCQKDAIIVSNEMTNKVRLTTEHRPILIILFLHLRTNLKYHIFKKWGILTRLYNLMVLPQVAICEASRSFGSP